LGKGKVVLTFKRSGSSYCLRTMRIVCVLLADGLWGGFQPAVCGVLHVFLFAFRSIHLADSLKGEAGQSERWGRTVRSARTVRGVRTDGPLFTVRYWRFGNHFWTVRRELANGPPGDREQSVPSMKMVHPGHCRLPKSFASWVSLCFRFGIVWGLFLGLVGLLWLHDLGKLVWDFLVVNLGHKLSSSFGKNFYRLPLTPPLSGRLIGPSKPQPTHAILS
jgi:hypothetical protein